MTMIRKFLPSTSAELSTLADRRQVRATISTAVPDRDGDVIVQAGIKFNNFLRTGGTVLFSHNPNQPVAKCIAIGLGSSGNLEATVQFPPEGADPLADRIYNLIKADVLCSTSIGFIPDPESMEPLKSGSRGGPWKFGQVELTEFSFVSVPSNTQATVIDKALGKSGRVLSASNRDKLSQAHGLIADVIATAEPDGDEAEGKSYGRRQREREVLHLRWPAESDEHAQRRREAEALRLAAVP